MDSIEDLDAALAESWDIVIADDPVPLTPLYVLQALRERKVDVPLIVVSGTVEEAVMIEVMRAGAHDYVPRSHLQRLVPAIRREVADAVERRARRATEWLAAEIKRSLR